MVYFLSEGIELSEYMSIIQASQKQRKYAFNRMNNETTKGEAMLDAGYSETMSKKPSVIEASKGFHHAMATLASESGNVAMRLMHEMQARDLTEVPLDQLVSSLNTIANAWDKFVPKQAKEPIQDNDLKRVFSRVIDISTEKTEE